jgi:hypothetical protein
MADSSTHRAQAYALMANPPDTNAPKVDATTAPSADSTTNSPTTSADVANELFFALADGQARSASTTCQQ